MAISRLILLEASPLRIPWWYAGAGQTLTHACGGDLRRFYTTQHQFYGGIDLPARTLYVCMLDHHGERLLPRTMPARPETCRKAIAP